jgi:hypothetical protein
VIGDFAVGGIWESAAGVARARKLKVGDKVFLFGEEGVLLQSGQGGTSDEGRVR